MNQLTENDPSVPNHAHDGEMTTAPADPASPASVLSQTARIHVEGVEGLIAQNRDLATTLRTKERMIDVMRSKIDLLHEALKLTQGQLQFYQNFAMTMVGKIDAIQAVCADAVQSAADIAGKPAIARPSADDEARLEVLASSLAPGVNHATGDFNG